MMMRLVIAMVLATALVGGVTTTVEQKKTTTTTSSTPVTAEATKAKAPKKASRHAVPRSTSVYSKQQNMPPATAAAAAAAAASVQVSGDAQMSANAAAAAPKENPFAQGPVVAGCNLLPQAAADGTPMPDTTMTYVKLDTMAAPTSKRALADTSGTPKSLSYKASFNPSVVRFTDAYSTQVLTITLTPDVLNPNPNYMNYMNYVYVGVGIASSSPVGLNSAYTSSGTYVSGVAQSTMSFGMWLYPSMMSGNYSLLLYTHDSDGNYHYFNTGNSFQVISKFDPTYVDPIITQFQFKPNRVKPGDTMTMSTHVKWVGKVDHTSVSATPYINVFSFNKYWFSSNSNIMSAMCSKAMSWKLVSGDATTEGTYESACTVAPDATTGIYFLQVSTSRHYPKTNFTVRSQKDSGEATFEVVDGLPAEPPKVVSYSVHPRKAQMYDTVTINVSIHFSYSPSNINTYNYMYPSFQFIVPTYAPGELTSVWWQFTRLTSVVGNTVSYTAKFQLQPGMFYMNSAPASQNYTLSVSGPCGNIDGCPIFKVKNALEIVGSYSQPPAMTPTMGPSVSVAPRVVSVAVSPSKVGPGDVITVTATVADFDYPNPTINYQMQAQWHDQSGNYVWYGIPCDLRNSFVQVSGNVSLGVYKTSCIVGGVTTNGPSNPSGMYYNGVYGLSLYAYDQNTFVHNKNYNGYTESPVFSTSTLEVVGAYDRPPGPSIDDVALSTTTVRPGQQVNVTARISSSRGINNVVGNISTIFHQLGGYYYPYPNMQRISGVDAFISTYFMPYSIGLDAPNGQHVIDVYVQAQSSYTYITSFKKKRFTVTVIGGTGGTSGQGGSSGGISKPTSSSAKHPAPSAKGRSNSNGMHKHWFSSTSSGGSKGGNANVNVGVDVNVDVKTGK